MHVRACVSVCARASVCMRLCLSVCMYVCVSVCLYASVCAARSSVRMCVCEGERVRVSTCVYIACMYIGVLRWSITTVCSVSARLLLTLTYVTHCIVGVQGHAPF